MQPQPVICYTVPEAMSALGICRDTIYKLIRSKKLVAKKIGRRTIVLASDLEEFLKTLPAVAP